MAVVAEKIRFWTVSPEWEGETVFVIASGPSVNKEICATVKGRRTIVVNNSYLVAPWADILFFGDGRWWTAYGEHCDREFKGRIATTQRAEYHVRHQNLIQAPPDKGLATDRREVCLRRTSLMAAMNLAVHLGAVELVLLGADMRPGGKGKLHHHAAHKWTPKHNSYAAMMKDLRYMIGPLEKRGIPVINTSMRSAIDWWPKRKLAECL